MYSVVVPVYNSTDSVVELVNRISHVFKSDIKEEFEIILVDDKSPNSKTWQTLVKLANTFTYVRVVQLTRNFGQQCATLCGMEVSKGKYIITMDDDLQHAPEDIPKLILHQEHDVVIAQMVSKKHSYFIKLTSRIKGWFDYILIGKPKDIQLSPFRLIKRTIALGMLKIKTTKPFIPALMFYVSKDVYSVKTEHHSRTEGKSNYSFRKRVSLFSNLLINNSSFLLRMLGMVGVLIASLSFGFGVFIIIEKLIYNQSPLGWTSVIVAVLFLGGMSLFGIGVIGEYLIRIISGVEHKPTYIIREIVNE